MVQLSHPYITTGKTIALIKQTFVGKVMSLLFNTLSRFVIAILLRSERSSHWLRAPPPAVSRYDARYSDHGLSSLHVELPCKYEESWPASYMKERCIGKESFCGHHACYSGQECAKVTPRCPQDDEPSPCGLNSSWKRLFTVCYTFRGRLWEFDVPLAESNLTESIDLFCNANYNWTWCKTYHFQITAHKAYSSHSQAFMFALFRRLVFILQTFQFKIFTATALIGGQPMPPLRKG